MPDIRPLPPSVVNKIAAGEVIERPASVVKELLENAVDAGARRIEVCVESGGTELVRVADDGCGIRAEQLPLAVASHATSKIADAEDLFRVHTLGFRGEALASIAEVSRLRLRSRTADSAAGAELEVVGGAVGAVAPCGCPVGTTVEVRQLFYNTPVRRKFLRSTQTELGHVTEAFTRIVLAYPAVHFTLRHLERVLFDLPPAERWRDRIATFFGPEVGDALLPIESQDGDVRLSGYAADPSCSRANNRMQYLFLNGRHIRDRSLQHALGEAYRGLLVTGRFPVAFLRLELPAEAVDVNVHPTKLEVRFQDGNRVYSQLLATLRQKFLSTDLTARVQSAAATADSDPTGAHDREQAARHRAELIDWAHGQTTGRPPPWEQGAAGAAATVPAGSPEARAPGPPVAAGSAPPPARLGLRFDTDRHDVPAFQPFPDAGLRARPAATGAEPMAPASPGAPAATPDSLARTAHGYLGMQVHNRYLVTESEEGLVVIDQHALHERILYEQLREKVLAGTLEKQRLLVPEPVTLPPAEAAAAVNAQAALAQLGIDIEPFGGNTVLVATYPAMLANFPPAEILRQAVEQLLSHDAPPERRELLDDLLHMIACKAAIKAGDHLSAGEIAALLEQRHLFQDAHHCPHGRPTALVFTREELDKRFKRT
jgi:DNA mismatch repair protein MutL